VNNSYIIMFKNGVSQTLAAQHFNFVQDAHKTTPLVGEESGVRHVYTGHFNGYAGRFSQEVIDQVRRMPEVDFVEKDQIVKAIDLDTQKSAPWVSLHRYDPIQFGVGITSSNCAMFTGSRSHQSQKEARLRFLQQVSVRRQWWRRH